MRNILILLIILSAIATVQSYGWGYPSYGYGFRRRYYGPAYGGFGPYGGGWGVPYGGGLFGRTLGIGGTLFGKK
ncbi:Tyrosine-protein kinase [Dirofilaria immitis]